MRVRRAARGRRYNGAGGDAMVTKEMIKSEVERVPDERLEELYDVVRSYARPGASDEGERARKIEAASESVFERRRSAYEELAKGAE
jgi:hypothetical protein